jgi:hypothetical protein
MRLGCAREQEVMALLDRGHWPEACTEELRAHVAGCRACRELVLVKQAFASERIKAAAEAGLESPGVLWWRAQLRRRNAALERIEKPFLGAQIFAMAVCIVAATVYVVSLARRGFDWLAWLGEVPRAFHFGSLLSDSAGKSPWEIWLVVSVGALVAVMGGLIVYVASEKR